MLVLAIMVQRHDRNMPAENFSRSQLHAHGDAASATMQAAGL